MESVNGYYQAFLEAAEVIATEYDDVMKEGREGEREGNGDATFTVVFQPFFGHAKIPLKSNGSPDMSVFAVDCFHFSLLGHEVSHFFFASDIFFLCVLP